MQIDRSELEALDRDQLVARARSLGVERPEVLTRLELVDEVLNASITDEHDRRIARGLAGRARDLVTSLVEKGLNLPDAAQRVHTLAPPISAWRRGPPPLATVALAEVYAAQGHSDVALQVLEEVLNREPDHEYARKLIAAVSERGTSPIIPAQAPPQLEWVARDSVHLDATRRPIRIDWEVRPRNVARMFAKAPEGRLILRMVCFEPTWEGPRHVTNDLCIDALRGVFEWTKCVEQPAGICVAVGWLADDEFLVIVSARELVGYS